MSSQAEGPFFLAKLSLFKEELKKAASKLLDERFNWVKLVFHDDADGVTSAAIIYASLKKVGISPSLLCLEKAFPEALSLIHRDEGGLIVYADIGSAHADLIARLNEDRNLTVILDHHDAQPSLSPRVINLNPELHEVSGEIYASGASVCYAFAKALGLAEPFMSALAVIGSAEVPGRPLGLNEEALKDALHTGQVEASLSGEEAKVFVSLGGRREARERWSTKLTTLSSVGYYVGGPGVAVDLCLGKVGDVQDFINKLEEQRKSASQLLLSKIKMEGLKKGRAVQWLHAEDVFKGMGTKVIGTFLSFLSFQRHLIDRSKYLVGFMNVEPEIPGLGRLSRSYVKVSARSPDVLTGLIKQGAKPPLSKLLSDASKKVHGFADGHSTAASGIIPKGSEGQLIRHMDLLAAREETPGSLLHYLNL
ncbi:MAG: DHH family phosphoesterase [Candidatus Nezhaarchaeota archaeon]|nr:DHH family phosphoesterase [Candidatus Nezhaarchaeota archaeon]